MPSSSDMFSRTTLKSFVKKRLCAAAEEIFVVVERILTEYEEQALSSKRKIEQQQRILDVVLKPQIKLHRAEIPEKRIKKTFEPEDEDHDDEDFPGFPAVDDSSEHDDFLEEPQSPLQGEAETGWSLLRLQNVKSRDTDTVSADFTVQEDALSPEIKEEPEELLIIPQTADPSSSTTSTDRMSGTNSVVVKRGRGRPRGRRRRGYQGRPRGTPPGTQTPDSCARTNAPGYVRRPAVSQSVDPISQVTDRHEPNGAVAKRGRGRPRRVYQGQKALHWNNTGLLRFTMLKEEPQEDEEDIHSSLDSGTSQPPGGEDQHLSPLSYHSDTDDDHNHDNDGDWEQTRGARPVRKSQRKVHREVYVEDESDLEQTWGGLPLRKRKRKMKRERSSSVIDELPRHLKSQNPTVKSEERNHLPPTRAGTATKALFCTFCGKKFPSSSGLKLHVMIHTGEKPFGCRFCDKHFRLKGNAKLHERTHTGEKPFRCPLCGQRFTQKCNMINHAKKRLCGKRRPSSPNIEDAQAYFDMF